jgi:selenide,water dikinase
VKLTEWTTCGGCAAKWGGAPLRGLLGELSGSADPDLLVGLAPFDDAAVYRISPDTALVSTTDFFPPLVDEPDDFGAIAAANACSDVFAMGGRVTLALNIAAFPEELPSDVIATILSAAARVVSDAGGTVAGGHTIRSPEPIFGLAVQGLVHPDRVWSKRGARPGDKVLLSKPLGTGVVLAGGNEEEKKEAVAGMRTLNLEAAAQLRSLDPGGRLAVHAVTDVTGFGLLGHGWELAERAGVKIVFWGNALPLYAGASDLAARGVRTGGEARNRAYLEGHVRFRADPVVETLVLDPQTSGGLLVSVEPAAAVPLKGEGWAEIGEVVEGPACVEVV